METRFQQSFCCHLKHLPRLANCSPYLSLSFCLTAITVITQFATTGKKNSLDTNNAVFPFAQELMARNICPPNIFVILFFFFFYNPPFFYLLPGQFLAPGFSSSCDARCQRTEPRRRRRLERESSKRGMFLSLLLCIANANMRKLKLFRSISICLGMQKMEKGNKIDMADFNLF